MFITLPWNRKHITTQTNTVTDRKASQSTGGQPASATTDIQPNTATQQDNSSPSTSRSPQTQSLSEPQQDFNWQTVDLESLKTTGILSTETKKVAGKDITIQNFSLSDKSAKVSISPELGANVLGLELAGEKVISSPVLEGKAKGSNVSEMEGMPLISPPNRTNKSEIYYPDAKGKIQKIKLANHWWNWNKKFEFNQGNMIHGRMHKEKWSLKEAATNNAGDLQLTYNFNTKDDPILSKKLGFAEFSMTYTISKNPETGVPALKTEVTVTNTGDKKSPNGGLYPLVGLGFHPYFNVDKEASFTAPVKEKLELGEKLIATGKLEDASKDSINTGRKASKKDGAIDATYTAKPSPQGEARSTITQGNGTKIHIDQSREMGFITVFNGETDKKTGQNKLCIEPLSCAPNASELQFKNKASTGGTALKPNAITLKPEESHRASFTISLEKNLT
ncbi:MAG: aldose 1-epimerase [Proteobacteria bacterium]|nr:aldose 1-epimerase [Pseudomonadota bacterium]